MRFQQLFERASPVLYHYTTAYAALDIVKNNRFQLSIGTANPSEAKLAPPGYDYFISMARTRTGDYHRYAHNGGTIFVLDGNWFNGRYPTKPVDYWERAWNYPGSDRFRESEDRVFSREPTIPADAVQQVHVLIKNYQPSKQNERVRQLLLLCKQRNLPVYFYIDEKAWRLLDTRSAVSPGYYKHLFRGERDAPYVREPDPTKPVMPRPSKARRKVLRSYFSKNYLKSWIELLYKKSSKDLSKDADRLRYDLSYHSWEPNDDNRLGMEISNARKPDGGLSRKSAIEILQYMRSHNLKTTTEFRNMIANKWKQIAQAEREQKKPMTESADVKFQRVDYADPKAQKLIQKLNKTIFAHELVDTSKDAKAVWWLAFIDGDVAGYCAIMQRGRGGYLSRAGVLARFRGQGLQKQMIALRLRYAKQQGWPWVVTDTHEENAASIASLSSMGFEPYRPRNPKMPRSWIKQSKFWIRRF